MVAGTRIRQNCSLSCSVGGYPTVKLGPFRHTCTTSGVSSSFAHKPLIEVTKADIELYLLSLKEKERSPAYLRSVHRNLAVCPAHDFRGARNIARLWLLWATGCRLDGLVKLKLKDLDWSQGRITVVEKGDKQRYAPFTADAQRALCRYLKDREKYLGKADRYSEIWIGEERRPMTYHGLQANRKQVVVKNKRPGIQGTCPKCGTKVLCIGKG